MKPLTIIAEDRTGLLAELTGILGARGVNISSIDTKLHGEDALISVCVDRYAEALHALEEEQFYVTSDDALLLRIEDKPGALGAIAKRLADQQIDIRSLSMILRHHGFAVVAVTCSDYAAARALLQEVCLR